MEQKTLNIIFGIVIFICIITMFILYISMSRKISNSLILDKLKVNEIEIDKSINVKPDLIIKGNYDFNKSFSKNKSKDYIDFKGLYIKNDNDKSKIPMELRLDDFIYILYTKNKEQFMENSINSKEDKNEHPYEKEINNINNEEPTKENNEPEEPEEKSESNLEEEPTNELEEEPTSNPDDDPKETFKNIPGYNIYYY